MALALGLPETKSILVHPPAFAQHRELLIKMKTSETGVRRRWMPTLGVFTLYDVSRSYLPSHGSFNFQPTKLYQTLALWGRQIERKKRGVAVSQSDPRSEIPAQ